MRRWPDLAKMTANAEKCVIFATTPTRGEALKRNALAHVAIYRHAVHIQASNHALPRRAARLCVGECSARHGSRLKPTRDSAPAVWPDCSKLAIFVTSSLLRASFVRRCARTFSQMHNFDASTAFHRNHLRRFRRAFGYVRRRDYRRFVTRHKVRHEKHPKVL